VLPPGTVLGHHEILELLGKGGMGEVYRARDRKLGRDVAIKVLRDDLPAGSWQLERFAREARMLAALNYPGIASIYGVEETKPLPYLVLELVEGETLGDRLRRGPVPLQQALEIARQISEALKVAHQKGIVHRDLKPANVKLTPAGSVKLLDFGLAKALTADGASVGTTGTTESMETHRGAVLGTAGYMSPEQTRGELVDHRTDIWSFGCVVYEILTGKRAFGGTTHADTVAAVLDREPDWSRLATRTPPVVRSLLRECLRKERNERLADIGTASTRLEGALRHGTGAAMHLPVRWVAWGVLLLAATAAAYLVRSTPAPEPAPGAPLLKRLTFAPGLQNHPTWSPDGRLLAYSSNQSGNFDIWVQQPDVRGNPIQITRNPAHDWQPDWSPDGREIVFRSERDGGGLYLVPALGGQEQKIASFGYEPRWSPRGDFILFAGSNASDTIAEPRLYVVSGSARTAPEPVLTALVSKLGSSMSFGWHPDGERVSISGMHRDLGPGFWTMRFGDGEPVRSEMSEDARLGVPPRSFEWDSSGEAIYITAAEAGATNILRVQVDPRTLKWIGPPQRLTAGPRLYGDVAAASGGRRVAFVAEDVRTRAWSFRFDARTGRLQGDPRSVTDESLVVDGLDLTPDGRRLVFTARRADDWESPAGLWVKTLDGGAERLVLGDTLVRWAPRWSPDGRSVAYRVARPKANATPATMEDLLAIVDVETGREHDLTSPVPVAVWTVCSWCPSGECLLASHRDAQISEIVRLPAAAAPRAETQARRITSSRDLLLWQATASPDMRWIAFNAHPRVNASTSTIFVVRAEGGPWTPVTETRYWDDKPRWAPDGRTIYFVSSRGGAFNVWGIGFDGNSGRLASAPFEVTNLGGPAREILSDPREMELALGTDRFVVPVREVSGGIWMLEHAR